MSYVKHNFKTGDFLYADHLNEMEDGIIEAGGGYDLVIGVGISSINPDFSGNLPFPNTVTKDDFAILEGDFAALKEKIYQAKPVKVLLKHVFWYASTSWTYGVSHSHSSSYYDQKDRLTIAFHVDTYGPYGGDSVTLKIFFSNAGEIVSIDIRPLS